MHSTHAAVQNLTSDTQSFKTFTVYKDVIINTLFLYVKLTCLAYRSIQWWEKALRSQQKMVTIPKCLGWQGKEQQIKVF